MMHNLDNPHHLSGERPLSYLLVVRKIGSLAKRNVLLKSPGNPHETRENSLLWSQFDDE